MTTDGRRLLDIPPGDGEEGPDAFERRLLGAGRVDGPSDENMRRVSRAVAAAAATGVLAGGSAAASVGSTSAVLLKWLGGTLLVGALATGVGVKVHQARQEKARREKAQVPVAVPVAAPVVAPPVVEATPKAPVAEAVPEPAPVPEPAAPEKTRTQPKAASSLTAELALIDHARRVMDGGDARRALDELSLYERQYRRGALAPEMTMLRIDCLVRMSQHKRADAVAKRFFHTYPESPLGARVRSLLAQ